MLGVFKGLVVRVWGYLLGIEGREFTCFPNEVFSCEVHNLGPGVGAFFIFLGLGFPYNPLQIKKGTLFYS